jgi:hypothetical protein
VDEDIADGVTYRMAAEVGLLSHNVRVVGADYYKLQEEAFGARVLMGYFNNINNEGELVEFYGASSAVVMWN